MNTPDIELAIETTWKLQRRLIEAARQTELSKRMEVISGADVLLEALALAMGREVKEMADA